MSDRIYLIGARGSGKTTVGRLLAGRRKCPFIDLDHDIETAAGKTIAEIFAEVGEPGFRALEAAHLRCVSQLPGVIATGGGIVTNLANHDLLKSTGRVVWLFAPPELLWRRIQADPSTATGRPDLTPNGGLAEVRAIVAARESLYRSLADADIDTEDASPEEVAELIELALAHF